MSRLGSSDEGEGHAAHELEAEVAQPTAAVQEDAQTRAVETCDLCNKNLKEDESMDDHLNGSHAALLRWAAVLESYRPKPSGAAPESLAAIGKEAVGYGLKADGGPEKFAFVQNALTQLREVCKVTFPKATLFAFGSCVSLGCYDGEGDVDLTLVDADGWVADPPTWPPRDEAQVIKKLARTLRSAGFQFDDLEPVIHTRVPVIRRKHEERPLEGRRSLPLAPR